jgi:hypothetical protein
LWRDLDKRLNCADWKVPGPNLVPEIKGLLCGKPLSSEVNYLKKGVADPLSSLRILLIELESVLVRLTMTSIAVWERKNLEGKADEVVERLRTIIGGKPKC